MIRRGSVWLLLGLLTLVGIGSILSVWFGTIHIRAALVASGLMLVAGVAVFVLITCTNQANPGVIFGTYAASVSIRGMIALGGGLLAEYGFGWFAEPAIELWIWILVAYLVALAIETVAVVSAESNGVKG